MPLSSAAPMVSAGRPKDKGYNTADVQAAFSAVGVTTTDCGTVTPPDGTSGSLPNLAATTGNWTRNTITVPAGKTKLTVTISGGTGDADLYVRFGSQPTTQHLSVPAL